MLFWPGEEPAAEARARDRAGACHLLNGGRVSVRITLVKMPWQAFTWPSLAISTLGTLLTRLGHEVTRSHENLRFVERTTAPASACRHGVGAVG